jgi:hypothetical protein
VENDVDFSLMRGCKKEIKVNKPNIVFFYLISVWDPVPDPVDP